MSDAVVVGSGPNGLACAVELARNGVQVTVLEAQATIGGGTRTSELTVPGLLHDDCSATHPMAAASPFLNSLDLRKHGLDWLRPEVDLAHPLDDGSAGVMVRSIDETARALGEDADAWRRVFGSSSAHFKELLEDVLMPIVHVPRHPLRLIRFGIPAAAPASLLARSWKTPQARALFGGVAAHAFAPLGRPMSSSVGCALIDACHAFGWPVAKGGSRAITDALASVLREHGGRIETGRRVSSLAELGHPDVVVLDLAPGAVAGDRGGEAAGAGRPVVPAVPPRPGRLQDRPRGRGGRALDERVLPKGRDRPRRRDVRGDRDCRAGGQPRVDAGAALYAGRPAIPRGPESLEGGPASGLDLCARPERLRR